MSCPTENKFDYAGNDLYRFRTEINVGGVTYAEGDSIGGIITVPDVFGCNGYAYLLGANLYEKKGSSSLIQAITFIYLLNKSITLNDSDAFSFSGASVVPSDVEFSGKLAGYNTLETDYAKADYLLDIGGTREVIKPNGLPLKAKGSDKDLYLVLQNKSGGSAAYSSGSKIYLTLDFIRH